LVPEPKDGVDAMNKVTRYQPNDNRHRGNAAMVNLCRRNQDQEKGWKEGKNGELETHGVGESLEHPALKTRCKGLVRALNTQNL
jgi:hypothetical protein